MVIRTVSRVAIEILFCSDRSPFSLESAKILKVEQLIMP